MRSLLLFSILVCLPVVAGAKYRVFELVITDTATGKTRSTIGTLDDRQYRGYHLLKSTETIAIQAHWMCQRRTDYFQGYCPNPNAQTPTKDPL